MTFRKLLVSFMAFSLLIPLNVAIPLQGQTIAQPPVSRVQPRPQEKFFKSARPIPNRYIVVYQDEAVDTGEPMQIPNGATTQQIKGLQRQRDDLIARRVETLTLDLASKHGAQARRVFKYALKGFAAEMTEAEAQALSNDPRVKYVEEDAKIYLSSTQTNPTWGLDRIDQQDRELNKSYRYGPSGEGVHVYVVDSGIRVSHEQFEGRATAIKETDFTGENNNVDCDGHGTHVAGTIGGRTYGVAKKARLHSLRVFDCEGNGTVGYIIDAIDWIVRNHESPAVANFSIGVDGGHSSLDECIRRLIARGVTCVVAAGNDNVDARTQSPGRVTEAITVGATDRTDTRPTTWGDGTRSCGYRCGSNFGPAVDIFAPGEGITSAYKSSDTATQTWPGTSMAAPHVTGVVAQILETEPTTSPETVQEIIKNTATVDVVVNPGAGSPNRMLYSKPVLYSFKSDQGQYVTAENGGGGAVNANRPRIDEWEYFSFTDLNGGALESGDRIHVQSDNGMYLVAESGGGREVRSNRTTPGPWETFTIRKVGGSGRIRYGDQIALQTSGGYYLKAIDGGGKGVDATSLALGPWESFTIAAPFKAAFRTHNGSFIRAENGGGSGLKADARAALQHETFALRDLNGGFLASGDSIFIRPQKATFLIAQNGGGRAVRADSNNTAEWETFYVIKMGGSPGPTIRNGDSIALRVHNGQYVVAENGGGGAINANRYVAMEWETFTIQFQ